MKRFLIGLICLFVALTGLCGCGETEKTDSGKIKIVATIFPQYDWVKQLAKGNENNLEIILLSKKGVDVHSFQPSAEDVLNILDCDLIIYAGGESDEWVGDALKNATNENMQRLSLLDVLKEEGETHSHTHEEDKNDHSGTEDMIIDEHTWLSLKNAEIFCQEIGEKLIALDPKNKEIYQKNLNEYLNALSNLDEEYSSAVKSAKKDTLVFADRFPFIYLMADYNINYLAAFDGCSTETAADFDTVFSLANEIDRLELNAVLTTDNGNEKLAQKVIENTKGKNQEILSLNSMQTVTLEDSQNGLDYLSVMEENLTVIKKALVK